MKQLITILLSMLIFVPRGSAQLSIEDCQQKALTNYPLIKQHELIKKTEEFNLSNAGKGYLPQLSISGKASYQSAVTQVPVSIPGIDIPTMGKDQYGGEIRLSQILWDGGAVSSKKEQSKATAETNLREIEANLHQIKNRINELYFGILLLDAQLKRSNLFVEELERNYRLVNSHIAQGTANQSDLDVVQVEILNTKQNLAQLQANKKAFVDILSHFVGENIGEDETFTIPSYQNNTLLREINRPELALYDAKAEELETMRKNINTALMPKFELFATGGYGKPGLNMLKDKFEAYYITGVRLAWNFGSLYTKKNDNRKIDIAQENIFVQRETFIFNTQMEMKQEDNAILKNRELLKHDEEIIRLRTDIRKTAEIKLANGIITTTDLMREVTAEDMAKQKKIEHEMELLMTIYKYKFVTNN